MHGKFDPYLALLDHPNTPTEIGSFPVQRLFSRRTRSLLPLSSRQLQPKSVPQQDLQERLISSKQKQAFYYNLKGTALPELQPGQTVRMKRPQESTWTEAVFKKMIGPHSYVVVLGGRNQQMSPYNQCHKQISPLLWNLFLNMWKLRLLLLLHGVAILSNHQPAFRSLRLRRYSL